MKLYEVSGSQHGSSFYRTLWEARQMCLQIKECGNDYELSEVDAKICADRQIELLNGYWSNARTHIRDIEAYDPMEDK